MKFIDENSLNRLNFKELLSRIDMYSGYGKSKLNNLSNFLVGEEEKLEKEWKKFIILFLMIKEKC